MATSIFNSLVVGVDGTIGSALFARLRSHNQETWGTTRRKETTQAENVFYLNLADAPEIWKWPPVTFDVVYICAGICKVAACEEDPVASQQVNVAGTLELARRLSQAGALVVFLSTNQVFSGKEALTSADAPYQPMNEYGRQKAKTEQLIKASCEQWAIVRLSKVIDDNMLLLQTWYNRLLSHQVVEAFHDMWLAPVMLRQVVDVLVKIGQERRQGCYQISGTADISYHELANHLADRMECSRSLVKAVSALDKGIKENFLPRHTTLDCSSTVALCGEKVPYFTEVVQEWFARANACHPERSEGSLALGSENG